MNFFINVVLALVYTSFVLGDVPTSARALHSRLNIPNSLEGLLNVVRSGGKLTESLVSALADELYDLKPTTTPTSLPEAASALSSVFATKPTELASLIEASANLVTGGLTLQSMKTLLAAYNTNTYNNAVNQNLRNPSQTIYPKKSSFDAPYSLTEAQLRAWIHIPQTFTYGKKPPAILVPGTGERGGNAYAGNVYNFLSDQPWVDPLWLNPTWHMLDDAQINGEMVAYAINYISSITGRNVSIITMSQGGVSGQWALKYWPSTRSVVSDFVAVSPDYHGTNSVSGLCSPLYSCPPAVRQQTYSSNFITALRSAGGDSSYVPTTTIYSSFWDSLVVPQQGNVSASAYLKGASNNEVQATCGGRIAGGFYSHESVLMNPLVPALIEDALMHEGPGDVSRLDLESICATTFATGTTIQDFANTESILLTALYWILTYPGQKTESEPPLKAYAR